MARVLLCASTFMLTSISLAQTQPSTQPSSDEPRQPDRILTLDECLKRFELDPRLTLCHVWENKGGDGLVGFVEQPQYQAVLERATKKDVSKITLLPELSNTSARFGIVSVEHVILRDLPSDKPGDRDNLTDLLLGEPVWILDQASNGALLVHASDGYVGWVEAEAVQTVGGPAMKVAINRNRTDAANKRAADAIEDADQFLGTPYLWGGKTKTGVDCSGLVQVSFATQNVLLPRDADQQANVGKLVATRWFRDALLPGDLLFFVSPHRGNVHHVAIHLGEGKFIHASGKDVHIGSLNPKDPEYDEDRDKTFAWARRVIE